MGARAPEGADGLAAGAHEQRELHVLGSPERLEGHARALLPGGLVMGKGRIEPRADFVHARGLELRRREGELEFHLDATPSARVGPARKRRVAAPDDRGEHGDLEQLQELGGGGDERQGSSVPGLLPLGKDADDSASPPDHFNRPVDRLDVGDELRLGYRADQPEEGPHGAAPHVPVARDPVDGLAEEGAQDEGVEDRDMVGNQDERRL